MIRPSARYLSIESQNNKKLLLQADRLELADFVVSSVFVVKRFRLGLSGSSAFSWDVFDQIILSVSMRRGYG